MDKPKIDHTGATWMNRRITGPGEYRKKGTGKGYWTWRWVCLDCGAVGPPAMRQNLIQSAHACKDKPRPWRAGHYGNGTQQARRKDPGGWICTEQCRECGHSFKSGTICCEYILDTGRVRPKVDLRTTPCPVRDPDFHRTPVTLTFGIESSEAQEDKMQRAWTE